MTKTILRFARVFTDIGDVTAIHPQNADITTFCRLLTDCKTYKNTAENRSKLIKIGERVTEKNSNYILMTKIPTSSCNSEMKEQTFATITTKNAKCSKYLPTMAFQLWRVTHPPTHPLWLRPWHHIVSSLFVNLVVFKLFFGKLQIEENRVY